MFTVFRRTDFPEVRSKVSTRKQNWRKQNYFIEIVGTRIYPYRFLLRTTMALPEIVCFRLSVLQDT